MRTTMWQVCALAIGVSGMISGASAQPVSPQPVSPAAFDAASMSRLADGIEIRSGRIVVRVSALTDTILRVRVGRDGNPGEDASWAVLPAMRASHVAVTPLPNGFATGAVKVTVDPATLKLDVTDLSGRQITADAQQPIMFDGRAFTLRKALPPSEHIYGLGDKTGGTLDRRSRSFVDWNTDTGFDSSTDPIYKSIPFFISVGGAGGSYGILLDNSWRSFFDFAHASADILTMGSQDGPIDYYVIAGPSVRDVVRRYTDLTGKAPLPPEWAFGYQQSRYSYISAGEVRQIAATLRQDRIPADVIWLDIDYQDRNRPFTINTKTFPDMKGLVSTLGSEGIKLVTITDLHVAYAPNQGYRPYDTGSAGNHFVHNADGSLFIGKVWPGPSVFPDFTDRNARRWWGTNYTQLVDDGVAGFWNDMNEPAVFNDLKTMPLNAVHHIDSDDFRARNASHAEIHNVFGMENTRATYDGVRALRPDERAFVMTRASYAGGQRYAVTWTGDNNSTFDHVRLMIHQLINLGLSGFSYAGADVGGFTGGPSPELMTRWFEIAAFTPIFRDHSAKDAPRAEPWVDGPQALAIRRRFVDERYRLLPYIYALADLNARTGDPLMRPVFYDYPEIAKASCDQSMAFTLGRSLLVAPPPKLESPEFYDVCLPAGGWYDYWTGNKLSLPSDADGFMHVREKPRLDSMPVFVRAGTILPRQPLVQSTSEVPKGPLMLDIYPGNECVGTIYLDDGHSMAFRQGHYLRQEVTCSVQGKELTVEFAAREGDYRPWWSSIDLIVHGGAAADRIDSPILAAAKMPGASGTLRFAIPDPSRGANITIEAVGRASY